MNRHTSTLVWLVLCLVFVLLSWNCAPTIKEVPITSYPLLDSRGIQHKYRESFDSFIFPRNNNKLTQYCEFHWEWEDIKAVYGRDENNEWGYSYIVNKNKKGWK